MPDKYFRSSSEMQKNASQNRKRNPNKRGNGHNYIGIIITVAVICVALITATIFGVSYLVGKLNNETPSEKGGASTNPITEKTEKASESETEEQTEPEIVYEYPEYENTEISQGPLILVNYDHEYKFPDHQYLLVLYENKTSSYKISDSKISLERDTLIALNDMLDAFESEKKIHDVIVTSGYRSYETQMDLYASRIETVGIEETKKYVAIAGYSEHHTGMAFDLAVYTDEGKSLKLGDKTEYSWIADNCYKYGFILRYDQSKSDITGIMGEEWHFRYVGVPHAYYMKKHNLALEEYITLLKGFPFSEEHLKFTDDSGRKWEIYYVPQSLSGTKTKIPVPAGNKYTVTGTNDGGFAVIIDKTGTI